MLKAVMIGALLLAAAVAVRWTATRVDALGRHRTFPVAGVAVPLLVAVLAGVPVVRHARTEARLGQVASALVGHRVQVRCETLSQAWTSAHSELGYVRFDADGRPEPLATLTVDACSDVTAWMGDHRGDAPQSQVIAVHVLTHEAMHLTGQADEARAECSAVQRDVRTATALGATPAQARAVATRYWRITYPELPPDYRSAECGPGGALDEGLPDPPWGAVKSS